jgi:hypothetical protein
MTDEGPSGQKDGATARSGRRTTPPRNGFGERLTRYLGEQDAAECVRCGGVAHDAWMHEGAGGDVWTKCVTCGLEARADQEGDQ